jgi:VanZ family protein
MTKPDKPTYLFGILRVVDSHAAVLSRPDMQSFRAFSMMYAARIIGWLLAAAIIVLSIVPPVLRPVTDLPHIFEHFAVYFATGLAFGSGYERRLALLPIAFVAFAAAIELAQLLVPGRHARLSDFIVNSLGLCVGLISAATFRVVLTRLQKATMDGQIMARALTDLSHHNEKAR